MQMAPARMMTSEHTLARIGRRMKTSESKLLALSRRGRGGRADLDRRAVTDLLHAGDDELLALLEARLDDVVVADDGAGLDRALAGHSRPAVAALHDVGEELPVDAVQR